MNNKSRTIKPLISIMTVLLALLFLGGKSSLVSAAGTQEPKYSTVTKGFD